MEADRIGGDAVTPVDGQAAGGQQGLRPLRDPGATDDR
jgi:hypothetical protein